MDTETAKIVLDENYYLTNDSNQWVLNFEKEGDINKKTGKVIITRDKWYYSSIQDCLQRYLNENPKSSPNIEHLIRTLEDISDKISSLDKIIPSFYI